MENKKIKIEPTKNKIIKLALILSVTIIFFISLNGLHIEFLHNDSGLSQAWFILKQFFIVDWSILPRVLDGMITSIVLAFVAVIISVVIALPISFLAANNLTIDNRLATSIKAFVAILRSIPTLVWGLMVIASIGFGNIGGVLTLVFIINCFLIRSFTGSIEAIGDDVIEALKSTGTPWIIIAIKGVLPMVFPSITAWIAISFELAVASSISLGMIGVGGVGKVLTDSLAQYKYGEVSVGIIVIFITMFIVEMSTVKIKSGIKKERTA